MKSKTVLLLLLIGLQIADVATTNAALATPGLREGNPLMAWAQGALGGDWWLIKVALACGGICALSIVRSGWPLRFATALYSVLVISNVLHSL